MTRLTTIRAETPRALNAAQECAVLRATVRDGVAPPGVRRRLAALLNQLDAFAETIALLGTVPATDYDEQMLLAAAYVARDARDVDPALAAALAAGALARTDQERSAALVEQAQALFRRDDPEAARTLLHEALDLHPGNMDACERLTRDLLTSGEAAAALAVTDALATHGVTHARLLEARATALVLLGDEDAARDTLRLKNFFYQRTIPTPAGWPDLASFNAALAGELTAHPAIRYQRHGTASVETWRIDSLVAGDGPLARQLVTAIAAAAQNHADTLAGTDHPWVGSAPRPAAVRAWCVITESSGYERWHMHPYGWMSGVYYVQVPDAVSGGDGTGGCLMLGMSDHIIGADKAAAVGHHLVRPRPGLLALFPSHSYHRTFPHRAPGKRICVAFDIGPA